MNDFGLKVQTRAEWLNQLNAGYCSHKGKICRWSRRGGVQVWCRDGCARLSKYRCNCVGHGRWVVVRYSFHRQSNNTGRCTVSTRKTEWSGRVWEVGQARWRSYRETAGQTETQGEEKVTGKTLRRDKPWQKLKILNLQWQKMKDKSHLKNCCQPIL